MVRSPVTPYEHMVERWEKDTAGDLEPDPHPSLRDFLILMVLLVPGGLVWAGWLIWIVLWP